MIGQKFHRLTVIERAESTPGNRGKRWLCQCECGNQTIARNDSLKNGRSKSCGCYKNEQASKRIVSINKTHGMNNTPEHMCWKGLMNRCNNKNSPSYKDYGCRGIKVCESWKKFENLYKDMGKRPEGTSIDRIDVNGDYCPENCRWATIEEQSRNKRDNIHIEYKGQTKILTDWAKEINISVQTLYKRLYDYGYSVEEAFNSKLNEVRRKEIEV